MTRAISHDSLAWFWLSVFDKIHACTSGDHKSVAFSPDGRRIVSGSSDKTLKVWDAESGQETLTLKWHTDWVTYFALTLKGHTRYVSSVTFSPDGRRIVSGGGVFNEFGELKVWDAETGEETLTLKGYTRGVYSVAFSPDGRRIVSCSSDRTLKVWDAETGQETLTLKGHTKSVLSVAFSPDGRRIVSGSLDETLKVWDAETGQEMLTLKGHTGRVASVAFSRAVCHDILQFSAPVCAT